LHDIEPYHKWRHFYTAENDERSPFYGRVYSEFQFSQKIYNYFIHPQWDFYGSSTMCMKLLFVDYDKGTCLIELLGEWNDCITNDAMILKRDIADHMMANGIHKFVLFCDNVLNFHTGDDDYYQEWYEDVNDEDGWLCLVNVSQHVEEEMNEIRMHHYFLMGDEYNDLPWRGIHPRLVSREIEKIRDGR